VLENEKRGFELFDDLKTFCKTFGESIV